MADPLAVFRVAGLNDASVESSSARFQRRAFLSPDVLRTYKLAAGEWISLKPHEGVDGQRVIVQLWPRAGVADEGKPTFEA